jgi:polyphosphate glucokinase
VPGRAYRPAIRGLYASAVATKRQRVGLGIDIGGTGVKAALVDLDTGALASRRVRVTTPKPSTPDAVAETCRQVVAEVEAERGFPEKMPVGAGLPCVVKGGRVMTAANIDKGWIGVDAAELFGKALGRNVLALNDADAAAIAEDRFGAGRDFRGTVLLLTIGTGIGSGLLVDGKLVPNTEFGHIEFKGRDAERQLSGLARERRRLRWKAWAVQFNDYLARLELYVWPDLIIIGGGVSKVFRKYKEWLNARAPIVPAQFLNTAGIIGAALAAADAGARGASESAPDATVAGSRGSGRRAPRRRDAESSAAASPPRAAVP